MLRLVLDNCHVEPDPEKAHDGRFFEIQNRSVVLNPAYWNMRPVRDSLGQRLIEDVVLRLNFLEEAGSLSKFLVRGFVESKGGGKLDVETPLSKVVFITGQQRDPNVCPRAPGP